MALTSSSTYAQVEAEYRDTADYLVDASAEKALRHAAAIRHLLILLPSSSAKGANAVGFNTTLLRDELVRAEDYARARRGPNVIRADFRSMRSHG
ncbi:MAG: hypothetical protein KF878_09805 [Planctomycetes bacterium]|nr:hypothetical protein [Planctomycetota bacterium]